MIVVHAMAIILYLPCREYGNSAVIFDMHGTNNFRKAMLRNVNEARPMFPRRSAVLRFVRRGCQSKMPRMTLHDQDYLISHKLSFEVNFM